MISDKEFRTRRTRLPRKLDRLVSWGSSQTAGANLQNATEEPPLRAELYNVEQLEKFARTLALKHRTELLADHGKREDRLLPRLQQNEDILLETYELTTRTRAQDRPLVPAAEWLLDNFYLVEEQILTARRHLPRSYSRALPQLGSGSTAHYPRVYALALPLIAHVDGQVDPVGLNAFIAAYQTEQPLTLGELWAVPIMLRLALIENLRRVAIRVALADHHRQLASQWAQRMLRIVEDKPTDLILVMADMVRANPPFSGAFLAELTRHLHGQSPYFAFANSWLDHRISEQGMTVDQLVRDEGQIQATDQVSMGNSITSLRLLSSTDWESFVESHSVVEKALSKDPAGVYPAMDFATRDWYRHEVESIAKRSPLSESEVADRAVGLAAAAGTEPTDRRAHLGYYLIDEGRPALEKTAAMAVPATTRMARMLLHRPLLFYLSGVSLLTIGLLAAFLHAAPTSDIPLWFMVALFMCAAHVGVATFNWLVTATIRPRPLPRLDYSTGVPAGDRTMVVIPTMLTSAAGVADLLSALEVRYLSNRDPHLHFALLTDLADAKLPVMSGDEGLVQLARQGIEHLNETYGNAQKNIFFLFHRPRRWNARDKVWMGHERKRGKLGDFNARLRGGPTRPATEAGYFSAEVGDTEILPQIRYVITLDTDTQLPHGAAHGMVSAMAHTLNRPVFDTHGQVVAGYTILQPRVGVTLPSSQRSRFARMCSGDAGIDPYTRVVSDVYQDLFGEGTFIGKGIYEVDAFERCCSNFPDNTILSHDLLESAYARSALLSDVILYEDTPSAYVADVSRRHRWIRGDWQIAGWLFPRVPGLASGGVANPISALSQWKILDNLRRSLVPVAMLAVLLVAWMELRPLALIASLFVFFSLSAVPLATAATTLVRKPAERPWRAHLSTVALEGARETAQFLLLLVLLPYDAWITLDAVGRTLGRMVWTHRKMLEWKTSLEAERLASNDAVGFLQAMWIAPALGIVSGVYLWLTSSPSLAMATPFMVGWIASPFVAWWLSRPLLPPPIHLDESQMAFLGVLSRRTWQYFEDFVTAEEHWLPPDNIQQNPTLVIATRTSPTNIGMALLANLVAYDFGYCSASRLLRRVQQTFSTLGHLEQYRGHFFNWYDTRTLAPLLPRYVSTVDSGNLAAHLLVLRQGLLEQVDDRIVRPSLLTGLRDTVKVLTQVAPKTMLPALETFLADLTIIPPTLSAWNDQLIRLTAKASAISSTAEGAGAEVVTWSKALEQTCVEHREDLLTAAPWLAITLPTGMSSLPLLDTVPTWGETATLRSIAVPVIDTMLAEGQHFPEAVACLQALRASVIAASQGAAERLQTLNQVARRCQELADMDFAFLFDKSRHLFAIGYNVDHERLDNSYYDLLASESRLGSFLCVAAGQVEQDHWFALGRRLTTTVLGATLLSWSGTMFEYLMPLLVMPTYTNTLLDQTYRSIVHRQIEYGKQRGVPWGVSESGYNVVDPQGNYQYRAFGVPGSALKRGLSEDLVVAPYATALALMVDPDAACSNLQRLTREGHSGTYGLFEAIDYTPSRLPPGVKSVTLRQVMAHHAGMTLLSLDYLLHDQPMQRRFDFDPMLRAALQLLQERVPTDLVAVYPHAAETRTTDAKDDEAIQRVITDPGGGPPEVNLLSNGRYHVMVTSAGGGYSRWGDLALTRWREDATKDSYGSFCYLRDLDSGSYWSSSWQPTCGSAHQYEAIFSQSRAEFRRRDAGIDCHTEIAISPEDDIEMRRITLVNHSDRLRTLEITTYSEVVLAPLDADMSHPAFSNLFVETELIFDRQAIFCTRRPRSASEHPPWLLHLLTVSVIDADPVSFETDRMKFIGRGRTLANPHALDHPGRLSDTQGAVLDPVACIRQVLRLPPGATVRLDRITGIAATRDALVNLTNKYHDPRLADRVFELAWTHSQILLQQLNASHTEAQAYGRLAGSVVYASALRRGPATELIRNRRHQSALWAFGISGDLPIVLVRIRSRAGLDLVRQAVQAHSYWRLKGLSVDLVVWNEDMSGYLQTLQDSVVDIVSSGPGARLVDKPGGIFVRHGEQMSEDDRTLLLTVARVILSDDAGTLVEQAERRRPVERPVPALNPARKRTEPLVEVEVPRRDVALFNGLGGFSHDGREYVMMLSAGHIPPRPWVNVIANPQFGTVISESGSAYTWAENSHEFRLTPWNNDAVTDSCGEALYIRDEETGRFWSPTPMPAPGFMTYLARHGFGYSVFEYHDDGIQTELWVFVAMDAPVKFTRLKITNHSGRPRQLSVTGYWEWVLGELRHKSLMHVVTEVDPASGALLARNAYHSEFGDRIAFVDCSERKRTLTGDRTEFIGRNGKLTSPQAMRQSRLSGRVGAGLDPAAGLQVLVTLESEEEKEVTFILGAAHGEDEARSLVERYRTVEGARLALDGVWRYWSRVLGTVHVETPDVTFNFLANGWLMYQILACRMWARTGFYQSGGAYGFRDQLQDSMALVHAEPTLLREHILRAASRQFVEGDVQHWWHPPVGRGVRTHISDDFLWLSYATCRYVGATGDTGVLDERLPFLKARALRDDEEGYYDLPQVSEEEGSLYEHCKRAISHGLRRGPHGLPLMGCGDWNDGMNRVGIGGQGESVWLGFFLHDVLQQFAKLATARGDANTGHDFTNEATRLQLALQEHAWDGQWYLRAWFDDGTPLGSSASDECQIDTLPQSWAVLSAAGPLMRSRTALDSIVSRLISFDDQLIRLFEPPFDKTPHDPGYIKGYPPGVRENGGQYTHAAVWTVMACAAMATQHGAHDFAALAWKLSTVINPAALTRTPQAVAVYQVEPYVMAADIYSIAPHVGQGGWTWYTGSASWMYRLMTESLLGLHLEVDKLTFAPCPNPEWTTYKIHYRYRETFYHVTLNRGLYDPSVVVDGDEQSDLTVHLVDDRQDHQVTVNF